MYLSSTITLLLGAMLSSTSAAAIQQHILSPADASFLDGPLVAEQQTFRLKTTGASDEAYNNRYLSSSHVGYGSSVPILLPAEHASKDQADQMALKSVSEPGYAVQKTSSPVTTSSSYSSAQVASSALIVNVPSAANGLCLVEWTLRADQAGFSITNGGSEPGGVSQEEKQTLQFKVASGEEGGWYVCSRNLPAGKREELFWVSQGFIAGIEGGSIEGCVSVELGVEIV